MFDFIVCFALGYLTGLLFCYLAEAYYEAREDQEEAQERARAAEVSKKIQAILIKMKKEQSLQEKTQQTSADSHAKV